jgi:2,5-diketo-D-gluconate reductase A
MPEQLELNDGSTIPQIGLGVWQVDPDITSEVVRWGIEAGYRLIDTAEGYRNEEGVGEAIRAAGVPRSELFITSKLRNGAHQRDAALRAFDDTMRKLGIDQIDLFLIHWPVPAQNKYVEAWKALVELKQAGRIKSVGVSNFNRDHLERIIGETGVTPVVNQIELHPRFQQKRLVEAHRKHGVVTEAWSPLGRGSLLTDPVIGGIAAKHGKSPAQTIIRWHLDKGYVVIPKSANAGRIRQNIEVFDFRLDDEDLKALAALDSPDGRTGPDPMTARF